MNFGFISDLYIYSSSMIQRTQRKSTKMNTQKTKNRKVLKSKMSKALRENIETLSAGMQAILIDDLITAFENRLEVLSNAQSNVKCYLEMGVKVANETF